MIISKAPFRISFCGGGSDLPSFYRKHGGCVLSTTINYYVYISVHPYFYGHKTLLKYSQTELVDDIDKIDHRIFKQVLTDFGLTGVEITSMADIPAGTGLGSSSSFTTALLNALYVYQGQRVSKPQIAKEACEVEIEKLGNPIGKQDQYSAAFGGLNFIRFNPDDSVVVEPVLLAKETYKSLEKNLVMYYTGDVRSASAILKEQNENMSDEDKVRNLQAMCTLASDMRDALERGDLTSFGGILHENWLLKKTLANGITTDSVDELYDIAMRNGALGGKLLGAGGGGFLLFYCEEQNQERLRNALGLRELEFSFEHDGTSIIFVNEPYIGR
ncbi:GHMP family kinase ATP-binding protein [Alicyclobacillus mengziensis]|uniref:GHMP kinase n=1 Tax=Alicyclobacillus mengziensis TaxID=2931921 RepID=A0A9X7VYP2_9BACL|nr:hypothetical protein [Alicyclobacillus mengziensis]QSO47531.1 hypothetical protein JZ786_00205 [Alicyclobacillus mengziensis]